MKQKMTRRKVLELCSQLVNFFSDVRNTKFAYALQKNIRVGKPIEEAMVKVATASEDFHKFEAERLELCKTFAQKDEQLNPVTKDGHFVMGDNKEAFDKEYAKLRFAHGTTIREHEKKQKEVQKLLDEEIEVEFLGIAESSLPENLSIQQLEILEPILLTEA